MALAAGLTSLWTLQCPGRPAIGRLLLERVAPVLLMPPGLDDLEQTVNAGTDLHLLPTTDSGGEGEIAIHVQ